MKKLVAILAVAILLPACSGGGGSTTSSLPKAPAAAAASSSTPLSVSGARRLPKDGFGGILGVLIGDAPPRIAQGTAAVSPQQLMVGISEVDITRDDGLMLQVVAFAQPLVMNLLDYQTTKLNLGSGFIAPGHYSTITLVLDTSKNGINVNGLTQPVNVTPPSASMTAPTATAPRNYAAGMVGITIDTSISVDTYGASQSVSLDFNAGESVAFSPGMGAYVMAPAVFAAATPSSANASGIVANNLGTPVSGATVVAYKSSWKVANTATTDAQGQFTLKNLDNGTYSLYVYNHYTTAGGQDNNGQGHSANVPSTGGIAGPQITVNGSDITAISIPD